MTPELRRALIKRAERLERRLGVIREERESMTTTERQAADLLGRYSEPERTAPRPSLARDGQGDDWQRERAKERGGRPRRLTVTEQQLAAAGMLEVADDEDDDDE